MSGYIYLASPYSDKDERVRQMRFRDACRKAAELMQEGYAVVSPVAQSHSVARSLPRHLLMNHDFWMVQDLPVLARADKMVVLMLAGWEESEGVAAEIEYAKANDIPVEFHRAS